MNTTKPWLDQNGNLFPDSKIKTISKKWSAEIWEKFLDSTVDTKLPEAEVLTSKYASLCEEEVEPTWGPPSSLSEPIQKEIHSAINKLNTRAQKVLRLHFWENKSLREIAEIEKLSFGRIQQIKKYSLNEIRDLLENALHTSSYLIGGCENSDLPISRDEEIKEIYRKDLEGSYLK